MKLQTLYARRSDGKPQLWEMEIEGNKYRTIVGIVDGEKVTSEWTTCEGKNRGRANATTPEEQAMSEAKAKFKKKQDEGYFEDIKDIDKELFFSPMLAKKYDDCKELVAENFPIFTQAKYDGIRCILSKDGTYSRTGKKFVSVVHLEEATKEFFINHPNIVLDGELYADKFVNDFNKITSLVKKAKPTLKDLEESKKLIEYHVYDCFDKSNHNLTFSQRKDMVKDCLSTINNPSFVVVPTDIANNQKELDSLYEKYMEKGMEGQIIRLNKKYENKRTKSLLKRKEFEDAEFTVLGVEEGVGNKSGCAGAVNLEISGKPFKSNIKGTREFIRGIWNNREAFIGKTVTVRYQNLTPDGIPRFPYVVAVRDYE